MTASVQTGGIYGGKLVMLACHGVFDCGQDRFYGEHAEDQPIHEAQLYYALCHMRWQQHTDALLTITGGFTQAALRCSESQSYVNKAEQLGWGLPATLAMEPYALTSIENLLFSLYCYHQRQGRYPDSVDVISWNFKSARFAKTLQAICAWLSLPEPWPILHYFPVGDLAEPARTQALAMEQEYIDGLQAGLTSYYAKHSVQVLLTRRDVWTTRAATREAYAGYKLPFALTPST